MKEFNRLTINVCLAFFGFCLPVLSFVAAGAAQGVELVYGDYQQLLERKNLIAEGEPGAVKEYESLLAGADRVLQQKVVTIIDKKGVAPSGDKRDYLTLAPYFWPDPKKADGLPYIRRDGEVNPTTRGDNVDYGAKNQFFGQVNTLGRAAFYSNSPKYKKKAVELLEVWFVSPKTRMNPHLEYAQGIPGQNNGRQFGIIEWSGVGQLLTSIQLLRAVDALDEPTYGAIVEWFQAYLKWLQTSEKGVGESNTKNNHGTWYDVQVAGILLFLDKKDEARQLLESVKTRRIATQIDPDGRQPHELARTKSLSYSKMNLSAFENLVQLGNKVGVDLWNYKTDDGRSIAQAAAFLDPYIKDQKKWPYQQITPVQ